MPYEYVTTSESPHGEPIRPVTGEHPEDRAHDARWELFSTAYNPAANVGHGTMYFTWRREVIPLTVREQAYKATRRIKAGSPRDTVDAELAPLNGEVLFALHSVYMESVVMTGSEVSDWLDMVFNLIEVKLRPGCDITRTIRMRPGYKPSFKV